MREVHRKKAEAVEVLRKKIQESVGIILTDYCGLTVTEITELRKKLKEYGAEYRVIKNNQIERATTVNGNSPLKEYLIGPTAVVFEHEEIGAPVKVLMDFMKEYKKLTIKAGMLADGSVLNEAQVKELSKLPSREMLLAQVVGAIQAPITGLVRVLAAPIRDFVCVLKAISEKKK
jgi:large subunit ribosomal protein L10